MSIKVNAVKVKEYAVRLGRGNSDGFEITLKQPFEGYGWQLSVHGGSGWSITSLIGIVEAIFQSDMFPEKIEKLYIHRADADNLIFKATDDEKTIMEYLAKIVTVSIPDNN